MSNNFDDIISYDKNLFVSNIITCVFVVLYSNVCRTLFTGGKKYFSRFCNFIQYILSALFKNCLISLQCDCEKKSVLSSAFFMCRPGVLQALNRGSHSSYPAVSLSMRDGL